MSKKITLVLLLVTVSGLSFISIRNLHYQFAELKSAERDGTPFIKVSDFESDTLKLNFAYTNLPKGSLWLFEKANQSSTEDSQSVVHLVDIDDRSTFIGKISFKNSPMIPQSGEYYLSFWVDEGKTEIKSPLFIIKSNAPSVDSFSINPGNIKRGASANIIWSSSNTDSCVLGSLDTASNKTIVIKDNLPSSGTLSVQPIKSTYYAFECTNDEFKKLHPAAVGWAKESASLGVE